MPLSKRSQALTVSDRRAASSMHRSSGHSAIWQQRGNLGRYHAHRDENYMIGDWIVSKAILEIVENQKPLTMNRPLNRLTQRAKITNLIGLWAHPYLRNVPKREAKVIVCPKLGKRYPATAMDDGYSVR